MPASPAILVAGEALIDVIPDASGSYMPRLGGSPFNTAIALGRLGVPTAFAASISQDAQGERLAAALRESGVSLDHVARRRAPSSLAWVTPADATQGTRYAFYLQGTAYARPQAIPTPLPKGMRHLHVGSFSALSGPTGAMTLAAMQAVRGTCSISYDPNIRPLLLASHARAVAGVEARVKLATLVKASEEDFDWLYPGRDPAEAALEWSGQGPRLVVLTRGGAGAVAFFGKQRLAAPAPKIKIADTIGAGDTFMAGLLAAMHEEGRLGAKAAKPDATAVARWLDLAIKAAAICCARVGADPPWRREVG